MLGTVQNNTTSLLPNNVGECVTTQENHCKHCNCSCLCDRFCNGDIKKCTSNKAIQKKCTHCCGCFLLFNNPTL